ncbi:MAG: hypothetical protein K2P92_04810, partial [Bdellovibrionaceae bacterium]|nr:hypothetical protein [Pseudobdellovibrionaceae bacterium]
SFVFFTPAFIVYFAISEGVKYFSSLIQLPFSFCKFQFIYNLFITCPRKASAIIIIIDNTTWTVPLFSEKEKFVL